MTKYKIRKKPYYARDGKTVEFVTEDILDTERKLGIPKAKGNRHYQEYLEWVAEGNTAEDAD